MVLILSFVMLFLLSCTDWQRDHVHDPNGVNYIGEGNNSSSSSKSSSSSDVADSSSSSNVTNNSSSGVGVLSGTFTDERDDQTYNWIKIGDQIWMAENLNYGGPINAPNTICKCVGEVGTTGWLVDSGGRCSIYGRLYDWAAALDINPACNSNLLSHASCNVTETKHKGICPEGWHVPSDEEWNALALAVGGTWHPLRIAGATTSLKATIGWNTDSSAPGTNSSGFSALPGGYGYYVGDTDAVFELVGDAGYWWCATEFSADRANYTNMFYSNSDMEYYGGNGKTALSSVRCVQND